MALSPGLSPPSSTVIVAITRQLAQFSTSITSACNTAVARCVYYRKKWLLCSVALMLWRSHAASRRRVRRRYEIPWAVWPSFFLGWGYNGEMRVLALCEVRGRLIWNYCGQEGLPPPNSSDLSVGVEIRLVKSCRNSTSDLSHWACVDRSYSSSFSCAIQEVSFTV